MELEQIKNWLSEHKSITLPGFLKRNPQITEWVNEQTAGHSVKNVMERVYILFHGDQPKCLCGNSRVFNTFELGYRVGCNLGNKCLSVSKLRIENQKTTLLEKYGVESVSNIPGITELKRENSLKLLGVEHHTQTTEYRENAKLRAKFKTEEDIMLALEKGKLTALKKYGHEHHMKSDIQKAKVKITNVQRYGVSTPLQNLEINEKFRKKLRNRTIEELKEIETKRKETLFKTYGVTAASRINLSAETLYILDNKDKFNEFVSGKTRKQVLENLSIAEHTLYMYSKKYQSTELFARPLLSELEKEMSEFLISQNINFNQNVRTIISPLELDFYIPDLKIAIEVGSLYWHSEISGGRGRNYHYKKYQACNQLGITLITIFHDEWYNSRNIVESRLKNLLNLNSTDYIAARKCTVETVDSKTSKLFLMNNHIQGYAGSSINLALRGPDGDIVSLMTFAKPRYNKNFDYEIIRFCSSKRVVGGASKLFKHFLKEYKPQGVISYSNNRWGTGKVYKQLGFQQAKTTVGYTYTDYKSRYAREKFQKHLLVAEGFDPGMTEWQIMQTRNFDRVWDCGQTQWVYNK